MFEQLQERFSKIFKTIKGHGKISEKNISDAVREIRIALLESDVNVKVVSSFISRVRDKASGIKVLDSVTPGQQFIKVVLDELTSFLSSKDSELKIRKKDIISRNTQKKFAVLIFIEPIYLSISSVDGERFAVKVILGSKQSP